MDTLTYAEADVLTTQEVYHHFERYLFWLRIWEQIIKPPLPMLPSPKRKRSEQ